MLRGEGRADLFSPDKLTAFLSYAFWNSATKNCEGHRGYSVTPANPPFRQRFSGAHEVDFLGLTEPENNACFNTERTPAYKDLGELRLRGLRCSAKADTFSAQSPATPAANKFSSLGPPATVCHYICYAIPADLSTCCSVRHQEPLLDRFLLSSRPSHFCSLSDPSYFLCSPIVSDISSGDPPNATDSVQQSLFVVREPRPKKVAEPDAGSAWTLPSC